MRSMPRRVEFQEESATPQRKRAAKQPKLVRLAMKLPFVKSKRQANVTLIVTAILCVCVSGAVLFSTFGGGLTGNEPTYIEDIPEEQRDEIPPELRESLPSRSE